jgi:ankyrin repeat protein
LTCAADQGHFEVVTRLLDRGAEIDALDWFGRSALACAAANEHLEVCWLFLSRGAARGLIDALVLDELEQFESLLYDGIHQDFGDRNLYAGRGGRLSMLAVRSGALRALTLLLERRVGLCYAETDQHSLLAEAAIYGQLQVVEFLIGFGADVHEVGLDGATPLQWAIEAGQDEAAELLRKAGAVR